MNQEQDSPEDENLKGHQIYSSNALRLLQFSFVFH